MQMAVLTYPMAVAPMIAKCGSNMSARDASGSWAQVLFFLLFIIIEAR
jgi:hypothetical protein